MSTFPIDDAERARVLSEAALIAGEDRKLARRWSAIEETLGPVLAEQQREAELGAGYEQAQIEVQAALYARLDRVAADLARAVAPFVKIIDEAAAAHREALAALFRAPCPQHERAHRMVTAESMVLGHRVTQAVRFLEALRVRPEGGTS